MPDQKQPVRRPYEILVLLPQHASEPLSFPVYGHFGVVAAGSAEAAIQAAIESRGLPDPNTGRVVAIPQSNWNERDVTITQVPRVDVTQVGEAPQLVPDAPEDLPPAPEPAAAA